MTQHAAGDGIGLEEFAIRTLEGDGATLGAGTRTHVDDMVGEGDDLTMVLDDEEGVAMIAEVE